MIHLLIYFDQFYISIIIMQIHTSIIVWLEVGFEGTKLIPKVKYGINPIKYSSNDMDMQKAMRKGVHGQKWIPICWIVLDRQIEVQK